MVCAYVWMSCYNKHRWIIQTYLGYFTEFLKIVTSNFLFSFLFNCNIISCFYPKILSYIFKIDDYIEKTMLLHIYILMLRKKIGLSFQVLCVALCWVALRCVVLTGNGGWGSCCRAGGLGEVCCVTLGDALWLLSGGAALTSHWTHHTRTSQTGVPRRCGLQHCFVTITIVTIVCVIIILIIIRLSVREEVQLERVGTRERRNEREKDWVRDNENDR